MTPLDGVRVLDFTWAQAGPIASLLLADLGAEIWKIERPAGDFTRAVEANEEAHSWVFDSLNRGKRSVVLDLRAPESIDVIHRALPAFDVVVENFKPGTMARFGLGADELMQRNERLVYASCSGFGQGDAKGTPAFDLVIQGLSGLMSVTGYPGGGPARVPFAASDVGTGMFLAHAILSALLERERTGSGSRVEVSMMDSQLFMMWELTARVLNTGDVPQPTGSRSPLAAPYQAFSAEDGDVVVAAGTDRQFRRLCAALGLEELAGDERFARAASRVENVDELEKLLGAVLATLPRDEVLDRLRAVGVPCAPVHDVSDVVHATDYVRDLALETTSGTRVLRSPFIRDGRRLAQDRRSPRLGADTDALERLLDEAAG